jgi:hypothetical protein
VLEIILAAVLIAFGLLAIYFSIESGTRDPRLMLILFLGVACIVAGAWLVIANITLGLILKRLVGLALTGIGVFIVIRFPDVRDYQNFNMSRAGLFIGLIILILGLYLLFL